MSTEKNKEEPIINPFENFSLLDGPKILDEKKDESGEQGKIDDSKKTSGDKKDETAEEKSAREKQEKADALLAENARKQAEAADAKKKKESGIVEEEESEEGSEEEDNDSPTLKPFIESLASKGIVAFDEKDEDFKDLDYSNEEAVEKVIGKTIEKSIKEWKESYPEDAQTFLKYIEDGGDPRQFHEIYYGNNSWEGFKIDSEATQKIAIKESLKLAGYTPEEADEEISLYEDSGKLEDKAKQHLPKLQKYEALNKQELVKQQEAYRKQQEQAAKEYYDNLHKTWYNKEDLNGFKLNKVTKDKVWDFIYKPDKKTGKTGLQESYENNQDAQFMYAYLAMNNFDITKLEKLVENKVTSKVRSTLSNYTDQRFKTSAGAGGSERQDKVKDEPGFEGFRVLK